jgi:ribosome biogenesis GTPase / thiamine phosphate phosphatase
VFPTGPDLLDAYGWTAAWQQAFEPFAARGLSPARVILEHTHIYRLLSREGERLARVSGRFRHTAQGRQDFPAVGDWVGYRPDAGSGRAQIHGVLPRRSRFSRKAAGAVTDEQVVAANIDTVFLVMGCDQDFNVRRLERYLVLAWESGASPAVVLNKADAAADAAGKKADAQRLAPGIPVHLTSARTGAGLDALAPYLAAGRTGALLGSSGVGKSTIINRLLGQDLLAVREVRESDSRGRHTTRHRQLVRLPGGGMVIDTPGMRELQLWDTSQGIEETFDDLLALAQGCRFRDCEHRAEPGCAVRAAVETRSLPPQRLESYLKLQDERRQLEARQDERARQDSKRRSKILAKAVRQVKKLKPGGSDS